MDPTPVTPAVPVQQPVNFRRLVVFTSLAGQPKPKTA